MNATTFVRTMLRPMLTGKGRISRSQFLLCFSVLVISILCARLLMYDDYLRATTLLLLFWPIVGLVRSRLHDFNRSFAATWPVLLVFPIGALAPVVWVVLGTFFEGLYAETYDYFEVASFAMYAYLGASLFFVATSCAIAKGDIGHNEYGPTASEWQKIWSERRFLRI